ncbi:GIY-YIG nuclease family protein [Francisellaceae bacterium CB300]
MAFVYILASKCNGTIYIGVTSNLVKRVYDHKKGFADGFTKKYDVKKLVYYEQFDDITNAIYREKRLKTWQRKWKLDLINKFNPKWLDLYDSILG